MPAALCSCFLTKPPALCAASHSGLRGNGVLNGPNAASKSIIGYDASSSGVWADFGKVHVSQPSFSDDWAAVPVGKAVSGSDDMCKTSSSMSPSSSTCRCGGGVGARRLCLPCRYLPLRDKMDPAHFLTFFCFLLRFLEIGCGASGLSSDPC